jgi:hypothetical protein
MENVKRRIGNHAILALSKSRISKVAMIPVGQQYQKTTVLGRLPRLTGQVRHGGEHHAHATYHRPLKQNNEGSLRFSYDVSPKHRVGDMRQTWQSDLGETKQQKDSSEISKKQMNEEQNPC